MTAKNVTVHVKAKKAKVAVRKAMSHAAQTRLTRNVPAAAKKKRNNTEKIRCGGFFYRVCSFFIKMW
jgi:hypothetical protein